MEGIFREKFGDWSALDGFMEYNLGLWSHDLTPLAQELQEAGEPHLLLSWEEGGETYYSLLFSPCGFIVFELISLTLGPTARPVVPHPQPRWVGELAGG